MQVNRRSRKKQKQKKPNEIVYKRQSYEWVNQRSVDDGQQIEKLNEFLQGTVQQKQNFFTKIFNIMSRE